MVRLRDYLERYPDLKHLTYAAVRCLPGGEELLEAEVGFDPELRAAGCVDVGERRIVFREDPPDELTLLHELVHLAGCYVERYAGTLSLILLYFAENGVVCDLFRLLELTPSDLERAVREATGLSLEEWINSRGTSVPCSTLDEREGRLKFDGDCFSLLVDFFIGWLQIESVAGDEACRAIVERLAALTLEGGGPGRGGTERCSAVDAEEVEE
ncbi:MAG: hypothetical protein QXQ60_04115 [Thermofilum sp.]